MTVTGHFPGVSCEVGASEARLILVVILGVPFSVLYGSVWLHREVKYLPESSKVGFRPRAEAHSHCCTVNTDAGGE